jgi:c-di-GMP-binding flagellar brake protein YcgR
MSWLNFFSKRKAKRYFVHNQSYLVIQPNTPNEKKVQIIDISEGGCAFIYHGDKTDLEDSGVLNLLVDDCRVEQLRYATRADKPIDEDHRRRGVEFLWLGHWEKHQLDKFVKECCQYICLVGASFT